MDGSFPKKPDFGFHEDRRRGALEALGTLGVLGAPDVAHVTSILAENRDPLDQVICKLGLAAEDQFASAYAQISTAGLWDDNFAVVKEEGRLEDVLLIESYQDQLGMVDSDH